VLSWEERTTINLGQNLKSKTTNNTGRIDFIVMIQEKKKGATEID
jgi:hypothetical protein